MAVVDVPALLVPLTRLCGVQQEDTHPELRKYTEMARTVAGSKVGSWLGLSAFNQEASRKAIADAEGQRCALTCVVCWDSSSSFDLQFMHVLCHCVQCRLG